MTTPSTPPPTRYARSDGLSIAYQVFGSGTQDLVVIPGIVSHIELGWEDERYAQWLWSMGESFRVVLFDKRGQGMSDRMEGAPSIEQRLDDVRAVMQAAGCEHATFLALSEGGAMGALMAATYPHQVDALVLSGALVRFTGADDFPHSPRLGHMLRQVEKSWGTPLAATAFAPSRAGDPAFCERFGRMQRMCASPGTIRQLIIANDQLDVRAILPQIRRPTLVIHRRGDRVASREHGRYFADHVPDAIYLELPGDDHLTWEGDTGAIVGALRQFARPGAARPHTPESQERFLATVLFTDIVGSTESAAQLGDQAWRSQLLRFYALSREQLQAHHGVEVNTTGDGMLARFDGPARAVRCAAAICEQARSIGLEVRAGLHTGEIEAHGSDVSGIAVHIGARVAALAGAGEVLVSNTVKDLVAGSGLHFDAFGAHTLKGVPGEWVIHRALAGAAAVGSR